MRTIGLIYDPHVGVGEDRYEHTGIEVIEDGIEKLNDVGVDWTVIGGDIRHIIFPSQGATEWGEWHGDPDNYYYREDYAAAKALFDESLDSEYYTIRGNNDRPVSVYREFFPAEEYPRSYWFEDDGARYVFLDSNPHEGYHTLTEIQNFVSAPQLSMLDRLMDDDPEIPTFVFCHAPLAKHTELHDDWATATGGAGYYLVLNHLSIQERLSRGNAVMVNSGHYHADRGRGSRSIDGVEYVLARHLVHHSDPDYGGDVRWLTVDTEERTATVHYYDVGSEEEGTITTAGW